MKKVKKKIIKDKKPKKMSLKKLKDNADKLLTPIIIKLFPKCLLCKNPTQVAHHHFKKSESNRLRYEIDNLIPLCSHCHCALHCHETIYVGRIIKKKGLKWLNVLEKKKKEYCKVDRAHFEEAIIRLSEMLK